MIYLLHQGLAASAERYPEHPLVRFKGQSFSYADIHQRSTQLAHFLREQGIQRHDRIGIFLNKSVETMIAIYGIMKAGAAYVPIDPRSPLERLATVITDCGIRGLMTAPDKMPILRDLASLQTPLEFALAAAEPDLTFRCYDWGAIAAFEAETAPAVSMMSDDLAYIMVTSGSTGKPKYIMHTHDSGLSYTRLSAHLYQINHEDRLSNHSPLHFDMSTLEYLTAVQCGATIVIIPEAYTLFPANLSQLIQDERLTIWYSVPFAIIQLLLRGVLEQRDLSSLRWILYGGEPFSRQHLRPLMERLPNAQVSNVYGPAEVNQCTYYHLPPPNEWPEAADDQPVPIGLACPNAEVLILDEDDGIIQDDNSIGELVVRAPTMMQGYWQRPDLNATAFYRHSIAPDYDAIFYRTGDLGYRRADGLLEFVGRKDHQVKVRGFRVELAEVDHAITAHSDIEEGAAYLVHRDEVTVIEALAIPRAEAHATATDLLAYLRAHLPHYAVPETLHFVASLPRTGTGKIDRKALPKLAKAQSE